MNAPVDRKSSLYLPALVALLAAFFGAKTLKCGSGVTPPFIPPGSLVPSLPSWPVFNVAVRLNGLFSYLAEVTAPPNVRLHKMAGATWVVSGYVARALALHEIPDAIAAHGGSLTVGEIAAKTGTNPEILKRYLDAAEKMGLVATKRVGSRDGTKTTFRLTSTGELLRKDVVGSLRDMVLMMGQSYVHDANRAAGEVTLKAKVPRSGFFEANGKEQWNWFNDGHLEEMNEFDRTMTAFGTEMSTAIIADWVPPSEEFKFCDIAGGHGTTLALILQHYPRAEGIVFDRPEVVPAAREYLQEQGIADRASAVGGDFFDSSTMQELRSCDVFLLKWIIHNWDDKHSIEILRNLRRVGQEGARLLISDFVVGTSSIRDFELVKAQSDIFMLGMCPIGAKERTEADFLRLLNEAGYPQESKLVSLRTLISL
eukprot:CAMPEP_0197441064 /NCGR_PEP_ID=MMETSP1175-20131217/7426_1 /TAXON_ID=1003142 /ORGANISM="Triceratium dubium, Strain CCMP147" /LENGTH=425 /DNA_ID=CAMNT_0042971287 /DNA_START=229 /DNA_END=1502 /DNA_ORIENTATION=-